MEAAAAAQSLFDVADEESALNNIEQIRRLNEDDIQQILHMEQNVNMLVPTAATNESFQDDRIEEVST